jgi:hypothetical protein
VASSDKGKKRDYKKKVTDVAGISNGGKTRGRPVGSLGKSSPGSAVDLHNLSPSTEGEEDMEGGGKSSRGRPRKVQATSRPHDVPALLNGHHNEVKATFDANSSSCYRKREDEKMFKNGKKIGGERHSGYDDDDDDEEEKVLKPAVDDEGLDEGGSERRGNKKWWHGYGLY